MLQCEVWGTPPILPSSPILFALLYLHTSNFIGVKLLMSFFIIALGNLAEVLGSGAAAAGAFFSFFFGRQALKQALYNTGK